MLRRQVPQFFLQEAARPSRVRPLGLPALRRRDCDPSEEQTAVVPRQLTDTLDSKLANRDHLVRRERAVFWTMIMPHQLPLYY
jgi:hypothetical protein